MLERSASLGEIMGMTGTPGTGKKSIASLVASKLGIDCLGINDFARRARLARVSSSGLEVDTGKLRKRLEREVRGEVLLYGHLLPYVMGRSSVRGVVVLRCEPGVLKERLAVRKYSPKKVGENVEAELIGLVSSDAYKVFGEAKTSEVDTTYTSPREAAQTAAERLTDSRSGGSRIDWTTNYDSGSKLRALLSGA